MKTSDFDYPLPQKYIAQVPLEPRDSSRLMVYRREDKTVIHSVFRNLRTFLDPGDLLVLNQTRVIPARLFGKKARTGGKVEVLLLKRLDERKWEAIVGGKRLVQGKRITFDETLYGEIIDVLDGPKRVLRFSSSIDGFLEVHGHVPLPPYIHTPLMNPNRYQTVYARENGSAAAPTAGLHFTDGLLDELKASGIGFAHVTLHVGLDTFAPVTEDDPREHKIHTEWCSLDRQNAEKINRTIAAGKRVVAVGTTSVRTLETASREKVRGVSPFEGATSLFILPGYQFKVVDAMITNFHLPKSTLLMLVSAFTSREEILNLYETAKSQGYRFFSFGDAMLIL